MAGFPCGPVDPIAYKSVHKMAGNGNLSDSEIMETFRGAPSAWVTPMFTLMGAYPVSRHGLCLLLWVCLVPELAVNIAAQVINLPHSLLYPFLLWPLASPFPPP